MGVTNWKPYVSKCDNCDNLDSNNNGFVCQSLSGCIYDVLEDINIVALDDFVDYEEFIDLLE